MNKLIVKILFALCISQYTNAAAVDSSIATSLKEWKGQVESSVKVLTAYVEHFLLTLPHDQDNEFRRAIDDEINASQAELNYFVNENGKSKKAEQCAKAWLNTLQLIKNTTSKRFEECLTNQREEEVSHYYYRLIGEIYAGKKIKSSIENLEKDVEAGNGKDLDIEEKISSVKISVDLLKYIVVSDLLDNGSKILESVKNQSIECSKNQLENVRSGTVSTKVNAIECYKQA